MNKDQLQKELLEKIKPGVKASDLKKQQEKNSQSIPTNIPTTPPLKPVNPKPSTIRYETFLKKDPNGDQIKQLQQAVNYWSQTAQIHLTNLQRTTAELDNAEEEIKELKQTIKKLKQNSETTDKIHQPQLFTCSTCQQTLPQNLLRLIDQDQQTCRDCLNKMLAKANQLSGEEIVLKKKKSPETQPTFTCQTCQQTRPGEPHLVHVANFQGAGIIPQKLTKICSPCLAERISLANFYCPRTSEGKDTWDPKEPQFDCWCERREI